MPTRTVSIPSGQLSVVDEGAGIPLLLVHGFPLDHSMWRGQIDRFSSSHRVIAPDLRGFGKSPPADAITMAEMADDLASMLHALNITEPVVFCGLSMGGYVAWQFVERHRDKLRALILCDTRAVADTPEAAKARGIMAERVLREGPKFVVETMHPKLFAASTAERQPQIIEATKQVILSTNPKGIAAAARAMAQRPDVTNRLGKIDVPTLVIVGSEDQISTADEMKTIAAAIPGSKLAVIAGAGHMAPLEDPDRVNALIEAFLAALRA